MLIYYNASKENRLQEEWKDESSDDKFTSAQTHLSYHFHTREDDSHLKGIYIYLTIKHLSLTAQINFKRNRIKCGFLLQ